MPFSLYYCCGLSLEAICWIHHLFKVINLPSPSTFEMPSELLYDVKVFMTNTKKTAKLEESMATLQQRYGLSGLIVIISILDLYIRYKHDDATPKKRSRLPQ